MMLSNFFSRFGLAALAVCCAYEYRERNPIGRDRHTCGLQPPPHRVKTGTIEDRQLMPIQMCTSQAVGALHRAIPRTDAEEPRPPFWEKPFEMFPDFANLVLVSECQFFCHDSDVFENRIHAMRRKCVNRSKPNDSLEDAWSTLAIESSKKIHTSRQIARIS